MNERTLFCNFSMSLRKTFSKSKENLLFACQFSFIYVGIKAKSQVQIERLFAL